MQYFGIDWLATVSDETGVYLLGSKNRYGFLLLMVASLSWLTVGFMVNSWALILGSMVFFAMHLRGWINWRKRTVGTAVRNMKFEIFRSKQFTGKRAGEALPVANMNGVTTRIHWTDEPYKWHVNDGEEVFAVLDGKVEMRYRENGEEMSVELTAGDVFFARIGCEHIAHPIGEARILVVEKEGSI